MAKKAVRGVPDTDFFEEKTENLHSGNDRFPKTPSLNPLRGLTISNVTRHSKALLSKNAAQSLNIAH